RDGVTRRRGAAGRASRGATVETRLAGFSFHLATGCERDAGRRAAALNAAPWPEPILLTSCSSDSGVNQMTHPDSIYSAASVLPAAPLTASIFADRAHLRDQIRADVAAAGLAVRECTAVPALLTSELRPLSEVVLLDCPRSDARTLAALLQLDSQAA